MTKRITEKNDTIFLLDDEPHYLEWLEDYLIAKGYKTEWATNLDDAVQALAKTRFRLVMCDLSVPASPPLQQIIKEQDETYAQYPGAYAAHQARNIGHRSNQVVVYSVHDSSEIDRISKHIGVKYITKGRPAQLKSELDYILAYSPTKKKKT
jgi:CheY-like chemotaxis protein